MRRLAVAALLVIAALLTGLAVLRSGDRPDPNDRLSPPSVFDSHPVRSDHATTSLVRAFDDHSIVAVGESHNLQEAGRFYVSLLRNKRFTSTVDDIVVEFGNARYQDLIDRYVAGDPVSIKNARRAWRDTTQVGSWDAPIYERFFRAARAANRRRAVSERIRVLLGDPPIDWDVVDSSKDWRRFARARETFMARLIRRRVLAEDRKALVIAGLAHVTRGGGGIVDLLERSSGRPVFVVQIHLGFLNPKWERQVEEWRAPSMAEIAGTWIGRLRKGEGQAQDQLDALLYLGPPGTLHLSVPPPSVYRDDGYWRTLKTRAETVFGSFDAGIVFGAFGSPIYPEAAIDFSGIEDSRRFAECMRAEGVESFPDPRMEFDSFVFPRADVIQAESDPQFDEAARVCASILGLPPPPEAGRG